MLSSASEKIWVADTDPQTGAILRDSIGNVVYKIEPSAVTRWNFKTDVRVTRALVEGYEVNLEGDEKTQYQEALKDDGWRGVGCRVPPRPAFRWPTSHG